MTRADTDIEGARPPSPCEGSRGAVHPVILVEMLQETLVDGVQVDDGKIVPPGPSRPITTVQALPGPSRGICRTSRTVSRLPPMSATLRLALHLNRGTWRS
jgi:hypothetical protein